MLQGVLPQGRKLGKGAVGTVREGKWFGQQEIKVSFSQRTWEQSERGKQNSNLISKLLFPTPPTSKLLSKLLLYLKEAMTTSID
jgi:hypothetical protein